MSIVFNWPMRNRQCPRWFAGSCGFAADYTTQDWQFHTTRHNLLWCQATDFGAVAGGSCGVGAGIGGSIRRDRPGFWTPAVGWTSFQSSATAFPSSRRVLRFAPFMSSSRPSIWLRTLAFLASSGSTLISRESASARASISRCLASAFSLASRLSLDTTERRAISAAFSRVKFGAFVAGSNMAGLSFKTGGKSSVQFLGAQAAGRGSG